MPPGTLIYTGEHTEQPIEVTLITYDKDTFERKQAKTLNGVWDNFESGKVNWLNVDGLNHIDEVQHVGDQFGLHPLALEDVLNSAQLPKCENYGNFLFITLKLLHQKGKKTMLTDEHVSFVLGKDFLISFQERPGDIFDPLRERLKTDQGQIRKKKEDYLLYRLIDVTVDDYYQLVDQLFHQVQLLETQLLKQSDKNRTGRILRLRKMTMRIRRAAYPLRDAVSHLNSTGKDLIHKETYQYFTDVADHLNHITQSITEVEEMLRTCMELQKANIDNNMNSIMKVLTVVSTVFIPLTFIAGIYGMNFTHMPELQYRLGYPVVLVLMFFIALAMMLYFKRKGWF